MTVTFLGLSARSAVNEKGRRTYTEVYKLTTTLKTETAYTVGSHAGLPAVGSQHPDDANAYCRSLRVENTDFWKGWTVTATYSDERTLDDSDPSNDEIKVSWAAESYEEVILYDVVTNEAILNTANDPFSEPPTREATHLVATISANVTSVPTWILSYQDAINSDAITIGGLSIGIGKAKMQNLSIGQSQLRNGVTFYPLSFQIKIKNDGWKFEPLSTGFSQLIVNFPDGVATIEKVDCVNAGDQKPVSEPAMLDDRGAQIDSEDPADGHFMEFDIYPSLAFASLPGVS
jgi:hypothetical protein